MDVVALGLLESHPALPAGTHTGAARVGEPHAAPDPLHRALIPQGPHLLPPRAPGYVGHEEDVQAVCAALRRRQAVALIGMGGIGKSSLAAEAVHTLVADPTAFPGGITWVRCDDRRGVEGINWIADQLLAAWDVSLVAEALRTVTTPEEGVLVRERALQKCLLGLHSTLPAPSLVLLDNVEHELALSRLLEMLTPCAMTVLLTTRSEPASQRLQCVHLEGLSREAALQLFAERYRNRGGLWQAEQDSDAAARIVTSLGYLPLAIELAAARAARSHMPLMALAEEMRDAQVISRLRDPLEKGASVRYSLSKTLNLLTPVQRSCFATLGLPEGPDWPVDVIARMLAGGDSSSRERCGTSRTGIACSAFASEFFPARGRAIFALAPLTPGVSP